MDDEKAAELQVVENDQREDLSPLESAAGYQYLLSLPGYSMKKLIQRTGKSKSIIYDRLKLLELPKIAQDAVIAGRLPMTTAQLIGATAPEIRDKAAAIILGFDDEDGDPVVYPKGAVPPVETFREAEQTIKSLSADAETDRKRNAMREQLAAEGFQVLDDGEAGRVVYYDGRLQHGCGYVLAGEVCPRDPKGKTWEKVLKGTAATRYAAVHGGRYDRDVEAVRIYKREEANEALKKLGLWDAEGSAATKEKIERQNKKVQAKRDLEAMHADLDRIVVSASVAENAQIRAVLGAVLKHLLPHCDDELAGLLYDRRKLSAPGQKCGTIKRAAEKMTLGQLLGLTAEVCAFKIGGNTADPNRGGNYLREGRRVLKALLDVEFGGDESESGSDVRTSAVEEEVGA